MSLSICKKKKTAFGPINSQTSGLPANHTDGSNSLQAASIWKKWKNTSSHTNCTTLHLAYNYISCYSNDLSISMTYIRHKRVTVIVKSKYSADVHSWHLAISASDNICVRGRDGLAMGTLGGGPVDLWASCRKQNLDKVNMQRFKGRKYPALQDWTFNVQIKCK